MTDNDTPIPAKVQSHSPVAHLRLPPNYNNTYLDISSSIEQISPCRKYNRCGKSSCIHCQQIYANRKVTEVTDNIKNKDLFRIVLTVKSSPQDSLPALTSKLYESFKRLRRTAYWQRHIQGGLARLHVDYKESWNPHFDCIVEPRGSDGLDITTLSSLWYQITEDSFIINCQIVTKTELSHLKLSKYVLKPTFRGIKDKEDLIRVYIAAVWKKRKLQRFGTWCNTKYRKNWHK